MIVVSFALMLLMFALVFMAGVISEDNEGGFLLLIPALVVGAISLGLSGQEINERWSDWSVCEDGETQVDSVIIADCDDYYKYPGEPND